MGPGADPVASDGVPIGGTSGGCEPDAGCGLAAALTYWLDGSLLDPLALDCDSGGLSDDHFVR